METKARFCPGDYVTFVAREYDDVPWGCNKTMERTMHGKIFRVTKATNDDIYGPGTQRLEIECCELTVNPEACRLSWRFSSPMFELFEDQKKGDDELPELTFDDFCQEAQSARS